MSTDQHFAATKKVTLISGTINSLLAIFKIAIGFIGHSHALIADGLHSLSDLISDGLVFIAAKAGSRRPDKEHPYGHRRIETIAAIVIAIILLAAGGGIIFDAIRHLMQHEYLHKPDIWVLVVAGASIIANEYLYRYNLKVGKKIHSNLLISNAWHNRSDALTSFIVLISAIGAILGWRFLDAIGAIVIAVLIIRIAVKIIWDSSNELIDRAVDEKTLQDFTQTIKSCAGVISLHQLRTRLHGGHIFVDLHIQVEGHISVSEGHFIGQQVHIKLMHKFPKIAEFDKKSYLLEIAIPTECLYGFEPKEGLNIGLNYRVNRHKGDPQHFATPSNEYTIEKHPSLWSTFTLE
ncbi:MAG: cation diffusion facilitator family transporter [Gammaproteobacteria bacterium]|nr:cation diffusion facilitator family transporter [Gammaproteobacteria bacterium]